MNKDKRKPVAVDYAGQTYLTKSLSCEVCGEILTHSDKYGMHCDNECTRGDDIKAHDAVKQMLDSLFGPDAFPIRGLR